MSFRLIFKSVWANPGNRGHRVARLCWAAHWQFHKRLVRTAKIIRLPNGALFSAHPDCVVSSALIYAQWPEFRELQFVRRVLQRGDAVIDVGANVGHVSLLLADLVGANNIFAFEPTPVSFRRLMENWRLNGWALTNLFQSAVGSATGTVRVPDTTRPETKNSIFSAANAETTVEVPLVSLDGLSARWNGQPVGLLKIDIEGYECEAFSGARALLRENRPRLVMFESLGGAVEEGIDSILREARYSVFQLDDSGRPQFGRTSAQNLFAAPDEHVSTLR